MDDKFLQNFLKTGLFDIGDSDDRLKWLKSSISDLHQKFKQDFSILPKFTLVALDPNISDQEPVMIETETIISSRWEALRAKYSEMPRNIIRGVIINALHKLGTNNSVAARIIYLTAINFYPYAKLHSERQLIEEMLTNLGEIAEQAAIDEWSFNEEEPKLKIGTLKISGFKFNAIELDKAALKTGMRTAINNDPETNQGTTNGGDSQWGGHFATKSSEAISKAFDRAIELFSNSLQTASIEAPINKFFTEFKKALDSNLKASFSSLRAVERRSKLLWWKETLYSSSLKKSYRDVDKNILPILMSLDLIKYLPSITPVSVDYLLKDTLFLLNDKKDESISFLNYLTEISKEENKAILKPFFGNIHIIEGRISVFDFVSLLLDDRLKIEEFKSRTGVDSSELITFGDLSIFVLHNLLVQQLLNK